MTWILVGTGLYFGISNFWSRVALGGVIGFFVAFAMHGKRKGIAESLGIMPPELVPFVMINTVTYAAVGLIASLLHYYISKRRKNG